MRINILEAFSLKRKMARVSLMDDCEIANAVTGQFYVFRRNIYSCSQGAMLCELKEIASGSASDFEDLFSSMFPKLCHLVQPRIGGVPLLLGYEQGRIVPVSLGELCSVGHTYTLSCCSHQRFSMILDRGVSSFYKFLPPEGKIQQEPRIASPA